MSRKVTILYQRINELKNIEIFISTESALRIHMTYIAEEPVTTKSLCNILGIPCLEHFTIHIFIYRIFFNSSHTPSLKKTFFLQIIFQFPKTLCAVVEDVRFIS